MTDAAVNRGGNGGNGEDGERPVQSTFSHPFHGIPRFKILCVDEYHGAPAGPGARRVRCAYHLRGSTFPGPQPGDPSPGPWEATAHGVETSVSVRASPRRG